MKKYELRIATRFSDEEKRRMVEAFIEYQRKDRTTLEAYAAHIGIPYYTFREWYRDPRYNPEWYRRHSSVIGVPAAEEKQDACIERYLELKKDREISLHEYAGISGIPYYTLRAWWREYCDRNGLERKGSENKTEDALHRDNHTSTAEGPHDI